MTFFFAQISPPEAPAATRAPTSVGLHRRFRLRPLRPLDLAPAGDVQKMLLIGAGKDVTARAVGDEEQGRVGRRVQHRAQGLGRRMVATQKTQGGVVQRLDAHRQAVDPGVGRRRRTADAPAPAARQIATGDIVVDLDARLVTVAGTDVALTPKEFELLAHLVTRRGEAVSREQLMDAIWGDAYVAISRSLDVHMTALRAKLGRPGVIETIRGYGYRWGS